MMYRKRREEIYPLQREIADRIGKLRYERDMTQAQLAEKTGLNVTTLSLIENCRTSPTIPTLIKLSKAFGVTPYYLICGVEADVDG